MITVEMSPAFVKGVIAGILVIVVLGATGLVAYNMGRASTSAAPSVSGQPAAGSTLSQTGLPAPATALTPVPNPTPTTPSSIIFTVASASMSNGLYEAQTTAGQTLILPDYYTYTMIVPQDTYTASVIGVSGNTYYVSNVVLTTQPVPAQPYAPVPPVPSYPSSITFTAVSTTIVNGVYEAQTSEGQTLILPDYDTYNEIVPQDTYAATVTYQNGNLYYVTGVILVSQPVVEQYPAPYTMYYDYLGHYFQYTNHQVTEIAPRTFDTSIVRRERPPIG